MVSAAAPAYKFDLSGGHLALDFANTVTSRHTDRPVERLTSYDAVLDFAEQSRSCKPAVASRLRAFARKHPARARTALASARALRDGLFSLTSRWAQRRPIRAEDLEALNARAHDLSLDTDLEWTLECRECELDTVFGPIVLSALELLTSPLRDRIRMCEADDCIWVFLDLTKNHSRRWCSMEACGNRAKARRFYQKHR
jgi:predicted RNA-binding Zn ribbon-like protein